MQPAPPLPPFSCTFSPGLADLLHELHCTLAISTYQAGKVIFISVNGQGQLVQLPRSFEKAMGIAVQDNKLAIATKDEVMVLAHSPRMAQNYPPNPGIYDSLYMPRARYLTGHVDIHDLHWGTAGLWAVNTSFSCLCLIDENYSFTPQWQPSFVSDLEHDDVCHLNGLAMENGAPRYVTALGQTNTPRGWKPEITSGGCLIDVTHNSVLAENLAMPHSPRLYGDQLLVLLSATGEVVSVDRQSGRCETVAALNTFIRGMSRLGDYLFIGRSKLRTSSSSFEKLKSLPIGENSQTAGITVVHLPSGRVVGELSYQNAVEEIYDVQVLPGLRRPGILNTDTEAHKMGVVIPQQTYWANWEDKRA
ncbi:MAG: TIGR03032 family protein [Candidatus Sericytochromatia bacterium]